MPEQLVARLTDRAKPIPKGKDEKVPASKATARNKVNWSGLIWFPGALSFVLLVLPQFAFLEASFHADIGLGQVAHTYSLDNYVRVLADPFYLWSIWQTFYLSATATAFSLMLAVPTAYTLARAGGNTASLWLNVILATSLITVVIKLMGLNIIFGQVGPINEALRWLGLVDRSLPFVNNEIGVLIGLVQYTLPILILLLFGVVQTIPSHLEEAAEVHGAKRATIFFSIIVPLLRNGLISGGLIAFNMSMGAFTSAVLMGGGRVLIMPVLIQQHIIQRAEYGTGAALAAVLLVFVFAINVGTGVFLMRSERKRAARAMN
ncbi:ABC transporter permease [Nitratireductor mangrovi]|uniref:ABC transporter permease n=1 Tax=Nitratireductor mangrovi TaxID=2599600 RepID=A0A5B8KU43_9HYPH|nr:ABC transporter permease [Nitratireductor mangrovi]QDY99156.1 ABC transporter permease [Nitratireductor mangrovi]